MQIKQIFLIDDDVDDQELFLSALEKVDLSYACKVACNGQDALGKLTTNEVSPHIIFLDLNMPLMNGQQFLEIIQQEEQYKDIPVIIFTTTSNPRTVHEVKQLGAKDLITKPNSFDELISVLRNVLTSYS